MTVNRGRRRLLKYEVVFNRSTSSAVWENVT